MTESLVKFWERVAAYLMLVAIVGMFFPIPKVPYLLGAYTGAMIILILCSFATTAWATVTFLPFMLVGIAAIFVPNTVFAVLPPIVQLALMMVLWGAVLVATGMTSLWLQAKNQKGI